MKNNIISLVILIVFLIAFSFIFSYLTEKTNKPLPASSSLLSIAELPKNNEKKPFGNQLSSRDNYIFNSLNPNLIPLRDWSIKEPEIQAQAAAIFDPDGNKFLFQKNIEKSFPIASITKLMTANIVLENLNLDDVIKISKQAVMTYGENGHLVIGEELTVRDLIYALLIESSNDAAMALAEKTEIVTGNNFVSLMNKKAREIGLTHSVFVDPIGINPQNKSNISDLIELINYSFKNSFIWQAASIKEIEVISKNKKIVHHFKNTNQLLGELPEVIAGKTGYTEEAKGCMIVLVKHPQKKGQYLYVIILGSNQREKEVKTLINWVNQAFVWQ